MGGSGIAGFLVGWCCDAARRNVRVLAPGFLEPDEEGAGSHLLFPYDDEGGPLRVGLTHAKSSPMEMSFLQPSTGSRIVHGFPTKGWRCTNLHRTGSLLIVAIHQERKPAMWVRAVGTNGPRALCVGEVFVLEQIASRAGGGLCSVGCSFESSVGPWRNEKQSREHVLQRQTMQ